MQLSEKEKTFSELFSAFVLCSRKTCIRTGCVKLSLLWREYLPSALSVLGKSLEDLHVTNRDFLQLNSIHSRQ